MHAAPVVLTLNAGSSSLKFAVYPIDASAPIGVGLVDDVGARAQLTLTVHGAKDLRPVRAPDHPAALAVVLAALQTALVDHEIIGVGHRIVHGGVEFSQPLVLTPGVLARLADLSPLAPLHQPFNLAGVDAAQKAFPRSLQVGCFDTAFHRHQPWESDAFALPRRYYDEGVRRYGFHGLSYQYIAQELRREHPDLASGRVIVAHLGNGASMCAMRDGTSVGSTMGFSALDGLPMGTRCGQIDPGVILYLLDQGLTQADLTTLLYAESGLKGLSGLSHDMRALLASDDPHAAEAISYYVFRLRREIGALTAVLGGLDALVFCGGIGENAPEIRARAVEGLSYLGLEVDPVRNAHNTRMIGAGGVPILVIPTDEERMIASATIAVLQTGE